MTAENAFTLPPPCWPTPRCRHRDHGGEYCDAPAAFYTEEVVNWTTIIGNEQWLVRSLCTGWCAEHSPSGALPIAEAAAVTDPVPDHIRR